MSSAIAGAETPPSGFTALLNRLRANPKVPIAIAAAAAVAIVVVMMLWAKQPTYKVLFSNLGDQDGGGGVLEYRGGHAQVTLGAALLGDVAADAEYALEALLLVPHQGQAHLHGDLAAEVAHHRSRQPQSLTVPESPLSDRPRNRGAGKRHFHGKCQCQYGATSGC